eukprot:215525_1
MAMTPKKKLDLSEYLIYGPLKDYPVSHKESKDHFGDKLTLGQKLANKLTQPEIFNVICCHASCVHSMPYFGRLAPSSRFHERMSYEEWFNEHHSIRHPHSPQMFRVASFWSTAHNECSYHTEYRLISLEDNQPLKPLHQIYETNGSKTSCASKATHCAYCRAKNKPLRRCGGCKILFYCSTLCQKKHWELIHKKECKLWKKKYKNKTLTEQQIDDLCTGSLLKLSKLEESYHGKRIELFKQMIHERTLIAQKETPEDCLFDGGDSKEISVINTVMRFVIQAFDRDGDKKLNFTEWCRMVKELNLGRLRLRYVWDVINEDLGLSQPYEPSLSNGTYGSYIYPDFNGFGEILHGPREIMETLRWCAYIRTTQVENNEDTDFMDEYDLDDDMEAMKKAFKLLLKLSGHAQAIVCSGEPPEDRIYDTILEAVPYLNLDIASVIYNYSTLTGQHIIYVSWHKIRWLNLSEDQDGLWALYDRKRGDQYYDLYYLSKQDEKGYDDTTIGIEICDDRDACNKKLDMLDSGDMFAFASVDMNERLRSNQRWCLGQCASYIPNNSFNLNEYAILIGKVLEFHGLNPRLCHYIYIGVGVKGETKHKSKIVDAFNVKYGTNARYRPHKQKRPMLLHDIFNAA